MEKERAKVKHEMQLKIDKLKEDFSAMKVDLKQVGLIHTQHHFTLLS